MKDYIIYDRNEIFCFIGNAIEASKYLDMSYGTFMSEVCRIKSGKVKATNEGYTIVAISSEE